MTSTALKMLDLTIQLLSGLGLLSLALFLLGQKRWAGRVLAVAMILLAKVVVAQSIMAWFHENTNVSSISLLWWLLGVPVLLLCAVLWGVWITIRFAMRGVGNLGNGPAGGGSMLGAIVGAVVAELIRSRFIDRQDRARRRQ